MAEAKKDTKVPESESVGEHKLVHKGHGKYTIEGHSKLFPNRAAALDYIEDLKKVAAYEAEHGDLIPEGVDIKPRTLMYRGTLIEHPMNEVYLPDGTYSPYYDRAWVWGWARADGPDVAMKQAKGYRIVTRDDLEAAVEEGKVPEHYRSMLLAVDHGSRMQYGDLVLMRIPRVLWRQHRAAREEAAIRRIRRQDEANNEAFDRVGVKNTSGPIQNEVSSGLKISGM